MKKRNLNVAIRIEKVSNATWLKIFKYGLKWHGIICVVGSLIHAASSAFWLYADMVYAGDRFENSRSAEVPRTDAIEHKYSPFQMSMFFNSRTHTFLSINIPEIRKKKNVPIVPFLLLNLENSSIFFPLKMT